MQLFFYNPHTIAADAEAAAMPGMERFLKLFRFYNAANTTICDRTETIRTPVRTKSLFPVPQMRGMTKTLEQLCDERASELLARADTLDVPICVMWSGGIDSTLVLVSLLKNSSTAQKKRIRVLLTEESIMENPNFYETHIRGALAADSANSLPYILGTRSMVVGGEGNDQIFGSGAVFKRLLEDFEPSALHAPYNRDTFRELYMRSVGDSEMVELFLDICERLRAAAPMELPTNGDVAWWEKFCTKWQSVYMRSLLCVSPVHVGTVGDAWSKEMYVQFYMTDDFQLWSMNNMDKRIRDTWKSYKWPCKDIIYDFTKDADYRDNKTKWGSLGKVFMHRRTYSFIDESMHFYTELGAGEYYEPQNDFI